MCYISNQNDLRKKRENFIKLEVSTDVAQKAEVTASFI